MSQGQRSIPPANHPFIPVHSSPVQSIPPNPDEGVPTDHHFQQAENPTYGKNDDLRQWLNGTWLKSHYVYPNLVFSNWCWAPPQNKNLPPSNNIIVICCYHYYNDH